MNETLKQISVTALTVLSLYALHYFFTPEYAKLSDLRNAKQELKQQEALYEMLKDSVELNAEQVRIEIEKAEYELGQRFNGIQSSYQKLERRYNAMRATISQIRTKHEETRKRINSYPVDSLLDYLDSE